MTGESASLESAHVANQSLAPYVPDPNWVTKAACKGEDPDALFVSGAAQQLAKIVCRSCVVRTDCLAYALDTKTEFGVWGGMTERERRRRLKDNPEITNWSQFFVESSVLV